LTDAPLVELVEVRKRFRGVQALDGLSLALRPGTTVGLVGESGCGKSTAARLILGLDRPSGGELRFRGARYPRTGGGLRELRRAVGLVFQDPYDSLDPRFRVRDIVAEPLKAHGLWREAGSTRIEHLLAAVGLEGLSPDVYPAELSGGQRQRLGVARALALDPELVVLDEPTSALDVSVQAQILNLLLDLQRELGLGYLFISHDLEVVRRMSDEVVVLYAGSVMERGPAAAVTGNPRHPYSHALLSAVPASSPESRRLGDRVKLVEAVGAPPKEGCPFAPRCPRAQDLCRTDRPPLTGNGHAFACHFPLG
jgi:oligopeptide/dipeptide ABC transporter ATP-binding protein